MQVKAQNDTKTPLVEHLAQEESANFGVGFGDSEDEKSNGKEEKDERINESSEEEECAKERDEVLPSDTVNTCDLRDESQQETLENLKKLSEEQRRNIMKSSGKLTAVFNNYELGDKLWFYLPKGIKNRDAEKKWKTLSSDGGALQYIFNDKKDHIKQVNTQMDSYELLGEGKRGKDRTICSLIFLFFAVPHSNDFWKNPYVRDAIGSLKEKFEEMNVDYIQTSPIIETLIETEKEKKSRSVQKTIQHFLVGHKYIRCDPKVIKLGEEVSKSAAKYKVDEEVLIVYLMAKLFDDAPEEKKQELNQFMEALASQRSINSSFLNERSTFDPLELQFLGLTNSNVFIAGLISKISVHCDAGTIGKYKAVHKYLKQMISKVINVRQLEKGSRVDVSALGLHYILMLLLEQNGENCAKDEVDVILSMDARFPSLTHSHQHLIFCIDLIDFHFYMNNSIHEFFHQKDPQRKSVCSYHSKIRYLLPALHVLVPACPRQRQRKRGG